MNMFFLHFVVVYNHLRFESEQKYNFAGLCLCDYYFWRSFFFKASSCFFVFSFIVVGTSCKYNYIPLYTEFRLKINRKPVGNWYIW
jgi:hypothetical protein